MAYRHEDVLQPQQDRPAPEYTQQASLYPSEITVSGFNGPVQDVNLTLNNLTQNFPRDLDMLLVGPQGQNALAMSDVGRDSKPVGFAFTLDDEATNSLSFGAPLLPLAKPSNASPGDTFPAPAPIPGGGSRLTSGIQGTRGHDPPNVGNPPKVSAEAYKMYGSRRPRVMARRNPYLFRVAPGVSDPLRAPHVFRQRVSELRLAQPTPLLREVPVHPLQPALHAFDAPAKLFVTLASCVVLEGAYLLDRPLRFAHRQLGTTDVADELAERPHRGF